MARNVEIKARLDSVEAIRPRVEALATQGPVEVAQDDTFFACDRGRLKLRAFAHDAGELIFYRRPDQRGPKESFFLVVPTAAPDTLREGLDRRDRGAGRRAVTTVPALIRRQPIAGCNASRLSSTSIGQGGH